MTGISDDQVMAAFERWKNLEGEKARVADDLKELFAEQKAFGHDTKAMRAAFRLKVKLDEASPEDADHEAKVDLYLAALSAPRASRAYARENVEEFDAETGEVFDTRSPRKAAEAVSERTATNPVANPVEEGEHGGCDEAVPTVEAGSRASEESERQRASMVGFTGDCRTEGKEQSDASAASVGDAAANAHGIPEPIQPETEEGDSNEVAHDHSHAATAGTRINHNVPATAPKTARDFRPHCLKPDACGASGLDHCYSCKRAMKAQEEFA